MTDSLDETSTNIASSKFAVIKDATRRKEIKGEVAATQARLQERRAAFMDFSKVFEKSVKAAEMVRSMQGGQGVMRPGGSVFSDVSEETPGGGPGRPSGKSRPMVSQVEYAAVMAWSLDLWRDFVAAKRHFDRSLEVPFQGAPALPTNPNPNPNTHPRCFFKACACASCASRWPSGARASSSRRTTAGAAPGAPGCPSLVPYPGAPWCGPIQTLYRPHPALI